MIDEERKKDARDAFEELLRRHGYDPAIPPDLLLRAIGVAIDTHAAPYEDDPPFEFRYRRERGRPQTRSVLPFAVRYDRTEHHPDGAWLLFAIDRERDGGIREYDLGEFGTRYLAGGIVNDGWSPADTAPDDGTMFIARHKNRRPFVAWWGDPRKTGERDWTDGYEPRRFDEWRHIPNEP